MKMKKKKKYSNVKVEQWYNAINVQRSQTKQMIRQMTKFKTEAQKEAKSRATI